MAYRNTYANNYQSINSNPYLTNNDVRLGDIFTRAFGGGYDQAQQNKRTQYEGKIRLRGQDMNYGVEQARTGAVAFPQLLNTYSSLAKAARDQQQSAIARQAAAKQSGDLAAYQQATKEMQGYGQQADNLDTFSSNTLGALRNMTQNSIFGNFGQPTFGRQVMAPTTNPSLKRLMLYMPPVNTNYSQYSNELWNNPAFQDDGSSRWEGY